ncbi:lipoprotein LppR [Mycobacterium tuberculosis variant africanum]|nr:lipoprotein LppR [Mycobacterium tuberculosis variant africanum]
MTNRWRWVVPLFAVFLAAGCTTTTTGKAGLAPNAVPRPLMGSLIQRVPLDGAALSTLLNQPFQALPPFPPVFGAATVWETVMYRLGPLTAWASVT